MSNSYDEDPTIPPPGSRSGRGAESVLPYLVKTLAAKPQAQDRDETNPGRRLPVPRNDHAALSAAPDVEL